MINNHSKRIYIIYTFVNFVVLKFRWESYAIQW